jgi:hypothetical protein
LCLYSFYCNTTGISEETGITCLHSVLPIFLTSMLYCFALCISVVCPILAVSQN